MSTLTFSKKLAYLFSVSGLTLAMSSAPLSASTIKTTDISYAGSACAADSATISPSTSVKKIPQVTMVFSGWKNSGLERNTCSLTIPVKTPKGMQVGLPNVTYTGKATAEAELSSEIFFAGQIGDAKQIPVKGRFAIEDTAKVWSGCGESVNIRVNAALLTRNGSGQVNSLTISQLPTRRCR